MRTSTFFLFVVIAIVASGCKTASQKALDEYWATEISNLPPGSLEVPPFSIDSEGAYEIFRGVIINPHNFPVEVVISGETDKLVSLEALGSAEVSLRRGLHTFTAMQKTRSLGARRQIIDITRGDVCVFGEKYDWYVRLP